MNPACIHPTYQGEQGLHLMSNLQGEELMSLQLHPEPWASITQSVLYSDREGGKNYGKVVIIMKKKHCCFVSNIPQFPK